MDTADTVEVITRKVRVGNKTYLFEIVGADNFTVTPTMNKERAESIVWGIIVKPNPRVNKGRSRRRGGVKGT